MKNIVVKAASFDWREVKAGSFDNGCWDDGVFMGFSLRKVEEYLATDQHGRNTEELTTVFSVSFPC
jgi:hypothetical protein